MSMKSILIPLAAFAVTVTSANAFNSDMLRRAGLNDDQIAAFEEAKELREAGDKEKARDVLVAAGVDEDIIRQVREAMRQSADAIRAAVKANDYQAFEAAVVGSPIADIVDTEAEFDKLVEAHALLEAGNREGAQDIFDELGLPMPNSMRHHQGWNGGAFMSKLDDAGKAKLTEAMKNRNQAQVRQIMKEAGIDPGASHWPGSGRKDNDRKGSQDRQPARS